MYKITFQHRLKSMAIDFSFICTTSIPFVLIIFILKLENILVLQVFVISLIVSISLCKDLVGGKSIGKRRTNLTIISIDEIIVSPLKLIFRNIFIFIWPIEIIMCLINPEQKLGDILFMTKVVLNNKKVNATYLSKWQILIYFSIVLIVLFILLYSIMLLFMKSNSLLKLLYT